MFEEFSFETREMLTKAINIYGESDVALVMAKADGLTNKQIAEKIGRSHSRAQQLVKRAIRRMRWCGNDYFPQLEEKTDKHSEYYCNMWIHGFAICDECGIVSSSSLYFSNLFLVSSLFDARPKILSSPIILIWSINL